MYFFFFKGLDTEQPFLQFGRYVFVGEYQDVQGTAVFLELEDGDRGKVSKHMHIEDETNVQS